VAERSKVANAVPPDAPTASGVSGHGEKRSGCVELHDQMDEIDTSPTRFKIQTLAVIKGVTGVVLWLVTLFCVHVWSLLFYVWDFRHLFIAIFSVLSVITSVGFIEAVIDSPCPRLIQRWKVLQVWHRVLLLAIFFVVASVLAVCIVYVVWLGPTPKVSGY
jgi:hypothetical protein